MAQNFFFDPTKKFKALDHNDILFGKKEWGDELITFLDFVNDKWLGIQIRDLTKKFRPLDYNTDHNSLSGKK